MRFENFSLAEHERRHRLGARKGQSAHLIPKAPPHAGAQAALLWRISEDPRAESPCFHQRIDVRKPLAWDMRVGVEIDQDLTRGEGSAVIACAGSFQAIAIEHADALRRKLVQSFAGAVAAAVVDDDQLAAGFVEM